MRIHTKLIFLIFFLVIAFAMVIFILNQLEENRLTLLFQEEREEKIKLFNKFFELKGKSLETLSTDYSFWGEFVLAMKKEDKIWIDENIMPSLNTYNADIIWIYRIDKTLLHSVTRIENTKLINFILQKEVMNDVFIKKHFTHFFVNTPEGIVEVRGATIHPGNDIERKAPHVGYFFAGRLLSDDYMADFPEFIKSKLVILPYMENDRFVSNPGEGIICFSVDLPDFNGNPIMKINVRTESDNIKNFNRISGNIFSTIIVFIIVFLLTILLFLRLLIINPLNKISMALISSNLSYLDNMKNGKNEFSDISRLICQFFEQRGKLVKEISVRRKAEEEIYNLNAELETRVVERTAELEASNSELKEEIFWRKKAENEKKILEERIRHADKMNAIGTLAGGIAHDFNNILSSIIGYTELLLYDSYDDETKSRLNNILKAGMRAKHLVNQILTFSRQSEQEKMPVNVKFVIKEVSELLRASLPSTVEIRQNFEKDLRIIEADPTQIHQVIMNLCTNAYQSMKDKRGTIELTLKNLDISQDELVKYRIIKPGSYVYLSVKDNGEGIEPSIIDRVFEPYFTTKKQGEGTGLGLAVVHGIIDNHGGEITVDSEKGKGTIFHIYFPVSKDSKMAKSHDTRIIEKVPSGKGNILLVDDDEHVFPFEESLLKRLGYNITGVMDSTEALQIFEEEPNKFDLVITDHTMPKMVGSDLAKKILAIRPDMPVILCSGLTDVIDYDEIKSAGIMEFVKKPFDIDYIANIVEKCMKNKSKRDENENKNRT